MYHEAARFERSNFEGIDTALLQKYRLYLFLPSIIMTIESVSTNEPIWFFYYLTHWGVNVSAFSVIATMMAARRHSWQTTAMISTQCATALNLLIMVIFWGTLAPYIFPNLGWSGHDLYMRWHMVTLHLVPFIQTTSNTILTDMELIPSDWPLILSMGCLYMFFNALGKLDCGVPIYPVLDWSDPAFSAAGWLFLACVMTTMYWGWALGLRRWRCKVLGRVSEVE